MGGSNSPQLLTWFPALINIVAFTMLLYFFTFIFGPAIDMNSSDMDQNLDLAMLEKINNIMNSWLVSVNIGVVNKESTGIMYDFRHCVLLFSGPRT